MIGLCVLINFFDLLLIQGKKNALSSRKLSKKNAILTVDFFPEKKDNQSYLIKLHEKFNIKKWEFFDFIKHFK